MRGELYSRNESPYGSTSLIGLHGGWSRELLGFTSEVIGLEDPRSAINLFRHYCATMPKGAGLVPAERRRRNTQVSSIHQLVCTALFLLICLFHVIIY